MINLANKKKKLTFRFLTFLLIGILSLPQGFFLTPAFAEDSPEEFAREQEEAQRNAERQARKQAAREAEAEHERQEEIQEELEDNPPTPTPTATPSTTQSSTPTPYPDVVAQNTNTGPNSQNDASATSNTNADISVENSGSLSQTLTTVSNTGNNTTSGDPPPPTSTPQPTVTPKPPLPSCDSHQVKSDPGVDEDDHLVDSNALDGSGTSGGSGQQASESTPTIVSEEDNQAVTDGGSTDTTIVNEDNVTVSNSHCADIENDEEYTAVSGSNSQVGNEDANAMETGGVGVDARLENYGNTNQVEVDTNSVAGNTDTAAGSNNDTSVDNTTNLTVDNENQISANNHLQATAVSGGNTSTDHDGIASLTSGDIDIIVNLLNILNMNITGTDFTHLIINIFEDLTGEVDLDEIAQQLGMDEDDIEIIAKNSRTGKESHNDSEVNNELNLTVNNDNQAYLRNDVVVAGVSGANDVSRDEDRVDVQTGRIRILVALLNFINANFSGSHWYFAMVNIFANLHGDIVLPDPDGFLVGPGVAAINAETGASSNNDASVTDQNTIVASNQNQAQVTNNVTAVGDSGSNAAFANDDRVVSQTGDVNVLNKALSWLNTNIFGDYWVLLVVNVLGRWLGHVVSFPGRGNIDAPQEGILVAAAGRGLGTGPAISAENSQTGDGSVNDATVNNSNNWQVNNNNQAVVENDVTVAGVSGQNTTNQNDARVNVFTGWIDITSGLLNIINFNVTGRNWLMVMVNIFGEFWGNIVFPGGENLSSTSDQPSQTAQEPAEEILTADSDDQALGGIAQAAGSGGNESTLNNGNSSPKNDQPRKKRKVVISPTPTIHPTLVVVDKDEPETDEVADDKENEPREDQVLVFTSDQDPPPETSGSSTVLGISRMNFASSEKYLGLLLIAIAFMFVLKNGLVKLYRRKEVN